MKRQLATLSVPFPPRLMSTTRAPNNMSLEFGREVLNMYALKNGSGSKRSGVRPYGEELSGETITKLLSYVMNDGSIQLLACTNLGNVYVEETGTWVLKKSGLDVSATIRSAHFAGRLVICNGVDPVMSWDGSELCDVFEWIEDIGANLKKINASEFSIESDVTLYPVGQKVRLTLDGGTYVEETVSAVSESGGVVSVTLSSSAISVDLLAVAFEAKPPPFAYVYAAHDRLWGLGKGPLEVNSFGQGESRTFVYYTFGVNDETAWHNEAGALQYINLADKMTGNDEVVAMAVKDGLTAFFFKNNIQLWQGADPTLTGDFSWSKTIPLGAIHGDLVVEMPNDIAFFTRFGVRTLTRLMQTEQLDISDVGSEVDPSMSEAIKQMTSTNESYRHVQAFRYDRQGWFGFKPAHKSFVYQITGAAAGWSLFDGIFEEATAFLNTPDGALYLAKEGKVYRYDENVFDDDGDPILTRWWTPWLHASERFRRWANKYVEVISEQGAHTLLTLKRYKTYNASSYVNTQVTMQKGADYWDESVWDDAFWDSVSLKPEQGRDHFVADVFSYAVESRTTTGPFTIFGLKLYGTQER